MSLCVASVAKACPCDQVLEAPRKLNSNCAQQHHRSDTYYLWESISPKPYHNLLSRNCFGHNINNGCCRTCGCGISQIDRPTALSRLSRIARKFPKRCGTQSGKSLRKKEHPPLEIPLVADFFKSSSVGSSFFLQIFLLSIVPSWIFLQMKGNPPLGDPFLNLLLHFPSAVTVLHTKTALKLLFCKKKSKFHVHFVFKSFFLEYSGYKIPLNFVGR